MTEFGILDETGKYRHVRTLSQEVMRRCPHFIMVPEHYREDETCRCNDPGHAHMADWGYHWSNKSGRWLGSGPARHQHKL